MWSFNSSGQNHQIGAKFSIVEDSSYKSKLKQMAFKNITYKHTNSGTNSSIHQFVSQKLAVLEKYVGNETDIRVEVEFEKEAPQKSGPICRVEVNIWVAGTLYRAETTQETFEAAVDVVKGDLDQEMRKAHTKRNSLLRRGGRMMKEMMKFGDN